MKKVEKFLIIFLAIFTSNLLAQVPIITQPSNASVLEGQTAAFSVSVTGGLLPVTYQWQATFDQNTSNFTNIPGATNSSYTTSPTTLSMNNSWYRCVVTNDSGSTYSNYAILSVNPIIAPTITSHPSNKSILIGQTATFSVTATGTAPLSYQWYANNITITGANASTYTTDPIYDLAVNGVQIHCIVSNSKGSAESNKATLSVSYENSRVTDGLQVLYNFKEGSGSTVNDESGVGTPLNLTISNPTLVNWTNEGLNVNSEVRIKSAQPATKIISSCVASNELTFEAWFIPSNMVQRNVYARIMTMTNTSKSTSNIKLDQYGTSYNFHVRTTSTGLNGEEITNTENEQELIHYVATKDVLGNVNIYINGIKIATELLSGNFSNWDATYYLHLGSDAENFVYWQGTFYLTAIYSKALDQYEVNQNYYYGVDSDTFPLITEQPSDVILKPVGQTASFSVEAIGNAPLSYQWYRNNNLISGANSATYTTPPVTLGNNNDTYKCTITSNDGSVTSISAALTVAEPDERITLNMIAQYTFQERAGNVIYDVSGVGTPVNLNINTPNSVNWISDGIEITSEANIESALPGEKIYSLCTSTNQLTIETWIKPANTTQNGPSRIVNYAKDGTERNFSLTQEGNQYSGRLLTTTSTNPNGSSLLSSEGSVETNPQHVVFVFREDGVAIIFIDGVENVRKTFSGNFSTWDNSNKLSIVNEFIDSRPWLGAINYLAIFNRRLTSEEVLHNYQVGPFAVDSNLIAPSELSVTSTQLGKVNLSWKDNSSNEDKFIIERSESEPSVWQNIANLAANTISFLDTNVVEGKKYSYRVKAYNSFLSIDNSISNIDSVVISLKSPTGLVGKADVLGKITLNWTDNSSAETGYTIERGYGDVDSVIFINVGTVQANITTFEDFGIEEGILYSYRIKSFNDLVISNPTNILTIRSKASFINTPSNLVATIDPVYGIPVLTWEDEAFNENGYIVERRLVTLGSSFSIIDSVGANITTYSDATVNDSSSYIYRIYGFNDEYISDYSSEVFIDVLVGVNGNNNAPTEYALLQNYPNPFNPSTTIGFNLPEQSEVTLTIYNLLGQKIQTILTEQLGTGSYNLKYNAGKLTSGIYIYTLSATSDNGKKFVSSKKFILLK